MRKVVHDSLATHRSSPDPILPSTAPGSAARCPPAAPVRAKNNRLRLLAELHPLRRLNQQHPVRQHLHHLPAKRRAQTRIRRCSCPGGIQPRRRTSGAIKFLQRIPGLQRPNQPRDPRVRIRSPARVNFLLICPPTPPGSPTPQSKSNRAAASPAHPSSSA